MLFYVNGRKVVLTQNNFVAKGGEGSVFEKSNIAYKIYEDISKMIPEAKIKELRTLNIPNIIKPIDFIYDPKQRLVGFTMDWVGNDTYALCKLFTNTFRDNNNIENDIIIELVENIKNVTSFIHNNKYNKCLIVDGNELNYLVKDDFITPYFIDVNSWQTKSFPATAIMASIRDWRSNKFSVFTDWFAFAIVSFQLFVGIHPYKGKHKGYKKNDFEARVRNCISVFNPEVRIPPATRDFDLIPSAYKDWYYKVFEKGERIYPPALPGTAMKIPVKIILIQSSNNFKITFLQEFDEDILYHNAKFDVTKTKEKLYIGKTGYKIASKTEVLFTPLEGIPVLVKIERKRIKFKALNSGYKINQMDIECTNIMIIQNTLYLKSANKLIELNFRLFQNNIVPSIKIQWIIEPRSSVLFSNIIVQSVLGKAYIVIPLPDPTKSSCIIQPVPELDDYKIIDAKYDNNVCVFIGHKGNAYDRITLKIDGNKYICEIIEDVDYMPINFITLDNGVCIQIIEDNALEIFINRIDKPDVKRIEDPQINSTIRLVKDRTTVRFFQGKKLFELKME